MPRGRPPSDSTLRLRAVPCDVHGDAPCPQRRACKNRRVRAGLPPLLGKREARRIAASRVASWARGTLAVDPEILGHAGAPLSHAEREMVLDAVWEIIVELQRRAEK